MIGMEWEYEIILGGGDDWQTFLRLLNEAGREGWEAIGLTPSTTFDLGGMIPWASKPAVQDRPLAVLLKRRRG
jgi:hypothetical protein